MAKADAASRAASPVKQKLSKDELIHFYREMLLIRRFEEKAGQLYGMGLIGGFCHLYIGQEAVVVGKLLFPIGLFVFVVFKTDRNGDGEAVEADLFACFRGLSRDTELGDSTRKLNVRVFVGVAQP